MVRSKFAISMHILSILAKHEHEWLPSVNIASKLNMNAALVRKELLNLKSNHLIESREGKMGGSKLIRSADDIVISEVLNAVKTVHVLGFAKNIPSPQCAIGRDINYVLHDLYTELDEVIESFLSNITLKDFLNRFD